MRAIQAILLSLSLALAGCGVKSELQVPSGKPPPKGAHDESQPPQPIGR